jgi:Na+-translocating ferredoxin:NAD+ oxidoreductase subunit B
MASLAARILDALPQTQCTRCGYPDCEAYASAIAADGVPINQCPPGGMQGVERLAAITGRQALPLNPANGAEGPRTMAVIDEAWCIGCTLCIKACPTDAILGSNKRMHAVIEPYCTGCELCLPVCPVDCIVLENATGAASGWNAWSPAQAALARVRYGDSRQRRARQVTEISAPAASEAAPASGAQPGSDDNRAPPQPARKPSMQDVIAAAQARARSLRERS